MRPRTNAKTAAQDVGLASAQYANMAAVLGAQLKGMGTAADELVPKTDELIGLGGGPCGHVRRVHLGCRGGGLLPHARGAGPH